MRYEPFVLKRRSKIRKPSMAPGFRLSQAILTPPVLANLRLASGSLSFNVGGVSNQTVVVEACTNLAAPVWVPLQTNTLGNNPVNFSAPLQPPNCFYRLRNL
jgi:hypothetical protein